MSSKSEKYVSKSAMMKHEKTEGAKERKREYGSKGGMKPSAYPPKKKKSK